MTFNYVVYFLDAKTTSTSESSTTISRLELFLVPGYLGVCITYGIISTVQYGTFQWGPVYLVNDVGHSIVTGQSITGPSMLWV